MVAQPVQPFSRIEMMSQPKVDLPQGMLGSQPSRIGSGSAKPQQTHGIEQHRQGADLMVYDGRQRSLFMPPRRGAEQRPQPGGQHDAQGVDPEGENNDVLSDDANHFSRNADQ